MARKKVADGLRLRDDGVYEKQLVIDGRRVSFSSKDPAVVWQKIADYKAVKDLGPLFKKVAEKYRQKVEEMKLGTQRSYLPAIDKAIDEFGERRMKDIHAHDISMFFMGMSGLGYKTVSNQKTVLNGIWQTWIQDDEWQGDENPVAITKLPRGLKRSERELPEKNAVDIIKRSVMDSYGLFPYMLLYTGMRKGELLGLHWADIDFDTNKINVERSVTHDKNRPIIDTPKTKAGVRSVPLLAPLKTVLQQLKGRDSDYIFGGEAPLTGTQYERRWTSFCQAHGLAIEKKKHIKRNGKDLAITVWKPTVTAHQLRHEFCTIMFEADIDEKTAQTIMGHVDASTMRNIYTHLRAQKLEDAEARLNQYFAQNAEQTQSDMKK